ncbi:MAG: hypothetical protein DI568_15370 [Sphingomonas sp.]|nr:MAG: hypothetical protein DI568_15370 [Sphingomonas sp.]
MAVPAFDRETAWTGVRICASASRLHPEQPRADGTLHIGVTANLPARLAQHLRGDGSAFVKRYNLHRLVYAEKLPDIAAAIAREKALKAWNRA